MISHSMKSASITTVVFPHLKTINLTFCCNDSGWKWDIPGKRFLRNRNKVYLTGSYTSYITPITKALQSLDSLEYLHLRLNDIWTAQWMCFHLLSFVNGWVVSADHFFILHLTLLPIMDCCVAFDAKCVSDIMLLLMKTFIQFWCFLFFPVWHIIK